MLFEKDNQTGHMKSSMKKGDIAEKYKAQEPHYFKARPLGSAEGTSTENKEPTLRSLTTDSSRMPKHGNDDARPIGGNRR